jgi:uncharacterized protein (DUF3084 family)
MKEVKEKQTHIKNIETEITKLETEKKEVQTKTKELENESKKIDKNILSLEEMKEVNSKEIIKNHNSKRKTAKSINPKDGKITA